MKLFSNKDVQTEYWKNPYAYAGHVTHFQEHNTCTFLNPILVQIIGKS